MEEADFYFLFRAENNTAGTVLDGFEVVLLQPQSWRTANSGMPSHGRQPRDVEGRMNVLMKFKEIRRTSTFAWSPAASLSQAHSTSRLATRAS